MFKVIYWSGTGNTLQMAESIKETLSKEDKVELLEVSEASQKDIDEASGLALGCPSMGAEVLSDEMEDFVNNNSFDGKSVILFGSYDWGNGEWMSDWEVTMENKNAILKSKGLIVNLTPENEDLEKCKKLAKSLL